MIWIILLPWLSDLAQARHWVPSWAAPYLNLPSHYRDLPALSGEPVTLVVILFPWLLLSLLLLRKRSGTDRTAREHPVQQGESLPISRMIEEGRDINAPGENGQTLLYTAVLQDDAPLVRWLLDKGADFDREDPATGMPPLLLAAARGNAVILELLIRYGAETSATNRAGNTPLHLAVLSGHLAAVEVLLKYSANVEARNEEGVSVLTLAQEWGKTEIASAILRHSSTQWPYLKHSSA